MKRLGIFATEEEIEGVVIQHRASGMFLSGGEPMGDPLKECHRLALKHGLPEITGYYGMDTQTGEFVRE